VLQSQDEKDGDNGNDNDTAQIDDFLASVVSKGNRLSSPEWEAIKDKVCAENRAISHYNIDAIIIGLCGRLVQLDVGLSYLEHLTVSGRKLNIATIAQFMRMCYLCRVKGIDEQLIMSMYKDLCSRCPIMDAYTAENAILGLCLTSNWKLGLDLLDMTKLTCSPASAVYSVLIKTAYDNDEPNTSVRLISEMLQQGRNIRPEVFHAQLDYCHRTFPSHKLRWQMVEEFLKMFIENGLKPTKDVAERIRVYYHETAGHDTKVHAEFSTVTDRYTFLAFFFFSILRQWQLPCTLLAHSLVLCLYVFLELYFHLHITVPGLIKEYRERELSLFNLGIHRFARNLGSTFSCYDPEW